jgi:hypothetical protein
MSTSFRLDEPDQRLLLPEDLREWLPELPEELARRESRLAKIQEAKAEEKRRQEEEDRKRREDNDEPPKSAERSDIFFVAPTPPPIPSAPRKKGATETLKPTRS